MSHRNAPLSETGRLLLARCVVDEGWSLRRAAERYQVAVTTAQRYRELGPAGMIDRPSRPHHSPRRTATRTERRIIKVRLARRWGPARIAYFLGLNPATVHRVLTRYRLPRLAHLDRATGRVIRRYEHPHPGDLVHVDIKKLGNIPDGGGHRVLGRDTGRRIGQRHRTLTPGKTRDRNGNSHVLPLARHPHRRRHHPQTHPPLPATNQRQSGTVQPHPARRMGLRTALSLRDRTPRSLPALAPHLRSPPRPHRTRRQTTRQPHPSRDRTPSTCTAT
jgi:transposase